MNGYRPMHSNCDPEREMLRPGEVRVKCSLNNEALGWTYDMLSLQQKYLQGRQGVFLARNVILSNGDKIKIRLMNNFEAYAV